MRGTRSYSIAQMTTWLLWLDGSHAHYYNYDITHYREYFVPSIMLTVIKQKSQRYSACVRACVRARACMCLCACVRACARMCTRACVRVCLRARVCGLGSKNSICVSVCYIDLMHI